MTNKDTRQSISSAAPIRLVDNGDGTYSVAASVTGSLAKKVYAVTPSDTTDLANGVTVGLYVGGTGNVVVITDGGTEITFTALSGGMIHPIACKRIKATNTTATGLLAVY